MVVKSFALVSYDKKIYIKFIAVFSFPGPQVKGGFVLQIVNAAYLFSLFFQGKVKCGFHSCCGKNIRLLNNKMTASRSCGFSHGLVFSAKSLEEDEIFEVRVHILFKP